MALTKLVNGVEVPLTPSEEAEIRAEWEANAQKLPTQAEYAEAIQVHIDATARAKQYADGFALASYVNSTVFQWATEAATFVAWRDQVWLYAYTQLAAVQQGSREPPTVQDLVAELPLIQWPT